jgi:hypothetical protein
MCRIVPIEDARKLDAAVGNPAWPLCDRPKPLNGPTGVRLFGPLSDEMVAAANEQPTDRNDAPARTWPLHSPRLTAFETLAEADADDALDPANRG